MDDFEDFLEASVEDELDENEYYEEDEDGPHAEPVSSERVSSPERGGVKHLIHRPEYQDNIDIRRPSRSLFPSTVDAGSNSKHEFTTSLNEPERASGWRRRGTDSNIDEYRTKRHRQNDEELNVLPTGSHHIKRFLRSSS